MGFLLGAGDGDPGGDTPALGPLGAHPSPVAGGSVPRDITAWQKVLEAGVALGVTKSRPGRNEERLRLGSAV